MSREETGGVADEELDHQGTDDHAPTRRGIVTMALMLAMSVAALEQTVVSTAMPSIIAQLKGLDIYPWVFSAYLLAATVSTPLYGKLADLFGRRRVLLFGLGLFMVGSILSGLARSMPELIGMRVVQGLGAGAIMPIVLTMIGDLYTLEQRAKVQGWFSGVWGVSSLAGPALGGVLTDQLSWRWVFFVTVPFGLVAALVMALYVKESIKDRAVLPIDWSGAALLTLGSVALLLTVLGGEGRSWGSEGALIALALVLLGFFVWRETRARDPILPLDLLAVPEIAAAIVGSFIIGALLFGIDTYVPLYVQGTLGGSATRAGRTITPLFVSWSISVAIAAKVVIRLGYRGTALVGSSSIAAGTALLALGSAYPAWSGGMFVAAMIVIGLGMGPTSLSYILAVQNAVKWERRGVATGAVAFFRTIGGALGVGVLGATLGWELGHRLLASGAAGIDVAAALRPETHAKLGVGALRVVRGALGVSLRDVFLQMFALTVLGLICAARLPAGRASGGRFGPEAAGDRDADLLAAAAVEP